MSLVLLFIVFLGCSPTEPAEEVVVALPIKGATARVQIWGSTSSEGRFEIVIETPEGSERHFLWEDWGPAQRTSLYLTPNDWIVILGGGGYAEMIALSPKSKPHWIPYGQRPKEDGNEWKYLGAVDRDGDHLVYYTPTEQRECVPLYGAGSSPYRKSHQEQHSCSKLNGD